MRKKKRRAREETAQQGPVVTPGVYRPFRGLKEKLPAPAPKPVKPPPPVRGPGGKGSKTASPEGEAQSFESAMSGVAPIDRVPAPPPRSVPPPPEEDELEVAERFLSAFVEGDVPFDFTDTEEYIQGSVQGLDPRLVHRLRRGNYAVEAHLDLHGLDRHEAKQAVRGFIEQSRKALKRCVLIVHGRGLGSKDGVPVLREGIKEWLSRGGIGRQVLAFTSARPADGGTGAVYVLLRR